MPNVTGKIYRREVMNSEKLLKNTVSYHDELIHSLRNRTQAFAYLQVALEEYQEDGDTKAFLTALRNIAEAQGGITKLAEETHLNRQSLYKTLSNKGNPRLNTLGSILKVLGFQLTVQPL
jgi:probable addiction module antidote protein